MRYIRDNNDLGLKYYSNIEDKPLSDLFRKATIKTENQLMMLYDSIWQDFTDTGRSIGVYIVFYKGGPIDHFTHVPGTVAQSSADSEWNVACTAGMTLAKFMMINNELFNKYTYVVPEQSTLIMLDKKSAFFMAMNGKDTKKTRHIYRRMNFEEMVRSAI